MFHLIKVFLLTCSIQSVLIIVFATNNNKYSKEANEDIYKLQKPFRIQKLNILWERATKSLDTQQLKNLLNDLKYQDKDELELKKIKADNQDHDGKKEAEVRRQLRMIMKKYSIDPIENQMSSSNNNNESSGEKYLFKHKKLDNLWKKIHKLDLNEEQLTILKEELKNFEDQLNDYHRLVNHYHGIQHEKVDEEGFKNHIDSSSLQNDHLDDMNQKLQQKHFELKEEYKRISDIAYNKEIKFKGEFEETKAARLWQMALKSDFSEEELAELKEKLLHFQNRIKKLNYFSGQLKAKNLKKEINELLDSSSEKQLHKHIENRFKELDSYVKKLHQQLEEILSKHSEL